LPFLGTIETTRTLRKEHPEMSMKYPWRTKTFYPVKWPAQAVHREQGRVVLPTGKGRPSLVLPIALPENAGACTLVWNRGFELHVCLEVPQASEAPGSVQATVDLGEIHLAAVTTNKGKALIVTGRGIRSLKRQRSRQLGQLEKSQRRCPVCGHRHKPKGRTWGCRKCGFRDHRDLVCSINMHQDAFGIHLKFPRSFTCLRPGELRTGKRSSRAGTPQRCLDQPAVQPHLAEMVSLETGHTAGDVQKPVSF
jgi:transposase